MKAIFSILLISIPLFIFSQKDCWHSYEDTRLLDEYLQKVDSETKEKAYSEVDSFMLANKLPISVETQLKKLYTYYYHKKRSSKSARVLKTEFRLKRAKLLVNNNCGYSMPEVYGVAFKTELMRYRKAIKLSTDQEAQWLHYYINYKDTVKTDFSKYTHEEKIKDILGEKQYFAFLRYRVKPLVKLSTKDVLSDLEKEGFPLLPTDEKLLLRYFTAYYIIDYRYHNKPEEKAEVLFYCTGILNRRKLLLRVNKTYNNKYKRPFMGVYQW